MSNFPNPSEGSFNQPGEQIVIEPQTTDSMVSASLAENEVLNDGTEGDREQVTESTVAIGVSTEEPSSVDDGSHENVRVEDQQQTFTNFPNLPAELRVKV
jgi:hypothetical protein